MKWYKIAQSPYKAGPDSVRLKPKYYKPTEEEKRNEEAQQTLLPIYQNKAIEIIEELMTKVRGSKNLEELKSLHRKIQELSPSQVEPQVEPLKELVDAPPMGQEQKPKKPMQAPPILDKKTPDSLKGAEERLPKASPLGNTFVPPKDPYFAKNKKKTTK